MDAAATHAHGGGGAAFSDATGEATRASRDLHRRHGTTSMVASLVSASPADLLRQVDVLYERDAAGAPSRAWTGDRPEGRRPGDAGDDRRRHPPASALYRSVLARAGIARVSLVTDIIAGSTATMDTLFRLAVAWASPDPDTALLAAVQQSSIAPAGPGAADPGRLWAPPRTWSSSIVRSASLA